MGGGIAAHLANSGFQVSLLDVSQQAALNGLDRTRTARPPLYYLPERANDIRVGNIEEHLDWAVESDWVCEAIIEDIDAKRELLGKLDYVLDPRTLVSTNTSGIEISLLEYGLSAAFRRRFMGIHFFNPPRYLRLAEVIPTVATDVHLLKETIDFLETRVGRRVVLAKDTPGFIANRFGMWSMFHATRVTEMLRLPVEEVDAITGPFMGRPKSGTFRLNDLVGLDVMRDVSANLRERCAEDPWIRTLELTNSMISLLARGWIGDKAGQGYYRNEGRETMALDLNTLAYTMPREQSLPALKALGELPLAERLRQGLKDRSEVGEFLRAYLPPVLRYANHVKEEISHSALDIDRVMAWGFGWEMGPFAMIDAIGADQLEIETPGPFYKDGSILDFKGKYRKIKVEPIFRPLKSYPQIATGERFVLRDLGDGITALSINSKMGTIDPVLIDELTELLGKKLNRFVLTSEAKSFSAGFDLRYFQQRIEAGDIASIGTSLEKLHRLGELLERHVCVAAVFGHCLGAGLELALSCPIIVADAETKIGLPESRVGLIPGGRGVALMRLYNSNSAKRLAEVAGTLTLGEIASNADLARQLGYLRPTDVTVYHPDRLLWEARCALAAAEPVERPVWSAPAGPLVGIIDRELGQLKARGAISEYDESIGSKIRQIFARSTSYEDATEKERTEFLDLCGRSLTQARIRHMIETNRPLRN